MSAVLEKSASSDYVVTDISLANWGEKKLKLQKQKCLD